MAEHSPSPTPERAIYGFVLYVASYLVFGLYVSWAYLPETWLMKLGITYLPQRFWVFAGPLFFCAGFVSTIFLYMAWNIMHTPSMNSMSTITDKQARVLPLGMVAGNLNDNRSVPPLADIDIRTVNQHIYLKRRMNDFTARTDQH